MGTLIRSMLKVVTLKMTEYDKLMFTGNILFQKLRITTKYTSTFSMQKFNSHNT
jgi:hypothetical protein